MDLAKDPSACGDLKMGLLRSTQRVEVAWGAGIFSKIHYVRSGVAFIEIALGYGSGSC